MDPLSSFHVFFSAMFFPVHSFLCILRSNGPMIKDMYYSVIDNLSYKHVHVEMEKWFSANSCLLFSSTVFLGASSLGIVITKESHSMSSIRNSFCLWFNGTKAPYVTSGDEAIVLQPFPFCSSILLQTMSIYACDESYNSQYYYKIMLLPSSNKGIFATS